MNELVTDHPYFGNVCSGFGGKLVCMTCGKHRFAHESEYDDVRLRILEAFQEDKGRVVLGVCPDCSFEIADNDRRNHVCPPKPKG